VCAALPGELLLSNGGLQTRKHENSRGWDGEALPKQGFRWFSSGIDRAQKKKVIEGYCLNSRITSCADSG